VTVIRKAFNSLPRPVRSALRMAHALPFDALDAALGRRDPLVPPRRLRFVGDGDYTGIGEQFLRYFVDLGGLRPSESVLDIGCGVGRMAAPLTRYLDAEGRYEGFDIVPAGIDWCRANITPRHPRFHFQLADIRNPEYRGGSQEAAEYRFPFDDASFDFAFATSVFTHMRPGEVRRYVSELGRVLRPGGRGLFTCFLLNSESLARIADGTSSMAFMHELDGFRTTDLRTPEAAIALPEDFVRTCFTEAGLVVAEPIRYGSWSGRPDFLSAQDIVIAHKP
jgi:SAM-dependent methyltransferase